MKPELSRRADVFVESVIREMTRLAEEHNAINLAQGFPDFPAPQEIKQAAVNAILEDHNQYSITWGDKELRSELSRKVEEYNHIPVDPEKNITVTCGSTEAMMATMLSIINSGDEVVIFEPFYENYGPDSIVSGAKPHFVSLAPENDFAISEETLKNAFNNNTKAIIINTPNNPTGKVFTKEELKLISDLCCDHNTIAITDEIYEHILYDRHKHTSMASIPGMAERTVTISGLSKTYSVTGWRIGYAIADEHLTGSIRKIHDFLTVGAPAPLQRAAITALKLPDTYYSELARMYKQKRDYLYNTLNDAGFTCHKPQGAYYIMAGIEQLTTKKDTEFARELTREIGVAAVPGSSFYHTNNTGENRGETMLRFTFSKKDETLADAASRLEAL